MPQLLSPLQKKISKYAPDLSTYKNKDFKYDVNKKQCLNFSLSDGTNQIKKSFTWSTLEHCGTKKEKLTQNIINGLQVAFVINYIVIIKLINFYFLI